MGDSADVEMVTIPRSLFESLLETIEVLSDRVEMEGLKRALGELNRGEVLLESEFIDKYREILE